MMLARIACAAVLGMLLSSTAQAQVSLATSPCFDAPTGQLRGPGSQFFYGGGGRTYDARGQTFTENALGGSSAVLALQKADRDCIVGPTIVGPVSPSFQWSSRHKPDGIEMGNATGPYEVYGAWLRNVNDALSPPKAPDTPRAVRFAYRHIYTRDIPDDILENDACLGGEITDSLFDGSFMGFSLRPGIGNKVNLGKTMPIVIIKRVAVRLRCVRDDRGDGGAGCPADSAQGMWWKITDRCTTSDGRVGPHYEIEDLVLYAEHSSRNGLSTMQVLPPKEQLRSVKNVTVLYTGPGQLPKPSVTEGVRIVTNPADAKRIWNDTRTRWFAEHGCDADGNHCSYLAAAGDQPPPEPPPPVPADPIATMAGAVVGLEAGTAVLVQELPDGNLVRAARNTGQKHSPALRDAMNAAEAAKGAHPAFAAMRSKAEAMIVRDAALTEAIAAGDRRAAAAAIKPELVDQIVDFMPSVIAAYEDEPLPDTDGDGITDDVDACPDLPAGDDDPDGDGCPDTMDVRQVIEQLHQNAETLQQRLEEQTAGRTELQKRLVDIQTAIDTYQRTRAVEMQKEIEAMHAELEALLKRLGNP